MSFRIDEPHPLYSAYLPTWRLMRDAIEGEDVVKDRATAYLPMKTGIASIPDATERSAAYAAYRLRAEFPEMVGPTVRGALGLIHERPAQIELPPVLEGMRERATPDGLTLEALHRRITAELLQVGRYGLLPGIGRRGAQIAGYPAESITSWDVDGEDVSFVALDESGYERNREDNTWRTVRRYRELYVENGAFVAQEWRGEGEGGLERAAVPRAARTATTQRAPLPFIPFVFVNSLDLTPEPDDVPLYGLARLAIRMYRLDADYMQALHMTAEPTGWAEGWEDVEDAIRRGLVPTATGSGIMWVLPKGGSCGYLEFSGPGLEAQERAKQAAREAAVVYGAQLFSDDRRSAESGEARKLRIGSQTATWKDLAVNSAAGLELALKHLAVWEGANPDLVSVKPNLDFVESGLEADEIRALVEGWQKGAYSQRTLFERLKTGKVVPPERTFEEELDLMAEDIAGADDDLPPPPPPIPAVEGEEPII